MKHFLDQAQYFGEEGAVAIRGDISEEDAKAGIKALLMRDDPAAEQIYDEALNAPLQRSYCYFTETPAAGCSEWSLMYDPATPAPDGTTESREVWYL